MLCVVQFTNSISRIMDVTILILYTLLLIKFQQNIISRNVIGKRRLTILHIKPNII